MRAFRWIVVIFVIAVAGSVTPKVRASEAKGPKNFTGCYSTCSTGYNECLLREAESKAKNGGGPGSAFIEK